MVKWSWWRSQWLQSFLFQRNGREGDLCLRKKIFIYLGLLLLSFFFLPFPHQAFGGTLSKEDEKEVALGKKVCEQVEKKWDRVVDPVRVARLEAILQRLAPEAQRPLEYEVRVISEDQPNAFSLPGGYIYFTTGMLDFARSDPELASIMAHEMVHTERKHAMIQSARNERLSLLALAVAVASRGEAAAVIMANIAQVAILNAYSRDLEKEADLGGLKMLNATGFPVSSAVTVMERLAEERLKHPYVDPGVFLDHPDLPERIGYMAAFIKNSGWPLHRKDPLRLLRTSIEEKDRRLLLRVDGKEVWSGPSTEEVRSVMGVAKREIDRFLQMELLPSDISVERDEKGLLLRVGRGVVVRQNDLPEGMSSLEKFSESLRKSVVEAQRAHPMGRYLL